jgi:hypothetical protein
MRMPDRLDAGEIQVSYPLKDIRQWDCEALLRSGKPGDLALALLANGGPQRLHQILQRAARLPVARRERLLAQVGVLAGLRHLSQRLKMEKELIELTIDQHAFLRRVREIGIEQGRAEGVVKGRAEGTAEGISKGKAMLTRDLLIAKFGPLPQSVEDRLSAAKPSQLERWSRKLLTAKTIEGVFRR